MTVYRSARYNNLRRAILAMVLVVAGIIAGIRFATVDDSVSLDDNNLYLPNITGEWIGTTSEDYGDEARYDYRIVFDQEGDLLKGMMYLNRNHDFDVYTETSFTGYVDGRTIFYTSQEILVIENAHRSQLCLAETTVSYDIVDGQEMMVGTWVGQAGQQPGCDTISGQVLLTRQSD